MLVEANVQDKHGLIIDHIVLDNVEQMFNMFDKKMKELQPPAAIEKIASLSIHSD